MIQHNYTDLKQAMKTARDAVVDLMKEVRKRGNIDPDRNSDWASDGATSIPKDISTALPIKFKPIIMSNLDGNNITLGGITFGLENKTPQLFIFDKIAEVLNTKNGEKFFDVRNSTPENDKNYKMHMNFNEYRDKIAEGCYFLDVRKTIINGSDKNLGDIFEFTAEFNKKHPLQGQVAIERQTQMLTFNKADFDLVLETLEKFSFKDITIKEVQNMCGMQKDSKSAENTGNDDTQTNNCWRNHITKRIADAIRKIGN